MRQKQMQIHFKKAVEISSQRNEQPSIKYTHTRNDEPKPKEIKQQNQILNDFKYQDHENHSVKQYIEYISINRKKFGYYD